MTGYSREIRVPVAADDGVKRRETRKTKFTKLVGNLVPVALTVENDKLECTSHEDSSPGRKKQR